MHARRNRRCRGPAPHAACSTAGKPARIAPAAPRREREERQATQASATRRTPPKAAQRQPNHARHEPSAGPRPRATALADDALDEQCDDQRDDRHLERIRATTRRPSRLSPSVRACGGCCRRARRAAGRRPARMTIIQALDSEPRFARAAGRRLRALNAASGTCRLKRSVLPRILGSNTIRLMLVGRIAQHVAARRRSSKPARPKSALTTSGSMR